jgi:heptosyltransferase-2
MEKIKPYQLGRIVVRAPTWVGDAVMSVPSLRRLRQLLPGAHITVAATAGAAGIFTEADFINDILILESGFGPVVRQLRRGKFDLALLFQNAFSAAMTAFAARVPLRIGYGTERRGFLLTTALRVPDWKNERHESYYYLEIINRLEQLVARSPIGDDAPTPFDLTVSTQRKEDARRLLLENGANDGPFAIICPGSVNSRAKRWPADRFARLADRLMEEGMQAVLIGSPAELAVSEEVAAYSDRKPILLTGKTTVADVVALISIAEVLVTNDTGPAHIGAALGTPTLVIFGPTNPLTTYPMSPAAEIIREPPDCAPCMLRDCPIDHRCMTSISVESVLQRVVAMTRSKV